MKELPKEVRTKWYKRAALFGVLLGFICHLLPPEYQTACKFVSDVCTGGF